MRHVTKPGALEQRGYMGKQNGLCATRSWKASTPVRTKVNKRESETTASLWRRGCDVLILHHVRYTVIRGITKLTVINKIQSKRLWRFGQ